MEQITIKRSLSDYEGSENGDHDHDISRDTKKQRTVESEEVQNKRIRQLEKRVEVLEKHVHDEEAARHNIEKRLEAAENENMAQVSTSEELNHKIDELILRNEELYTHISATQESTFTLSAKVNRMITKSDMESFGFWVTDSINELKKKMTGEIEKTAAKTTRMLAKRDLWTFSKAVDATVSDAINKSHRKISEVTGFKVDGAGMKIASTDDHYGVKLDEHCRSG